MFGFMKTLRKFWQERDDTQDYIYVFVRKDIPIWAQVVQTGHACLEAGRLFNQDFGVHMPSLVLLRVENEWDLMWAHRICGNAGIRSFVFWEPDRKSLGGEDPGHTALCTEPLTSDEWKKTFEDFELWTAEIK